MNNDLCPQCLAANVIATRNGPTCRHQLNSGVLWWPAHWDTMLEAERIAWLAKRQDKPNERPEN